MLFVELTVKRPVTQESLQLLEALNKIQDTPKFHVHNAVLEIWLAQHDIGGRHISALQHLICGLDDPQGEELQKVLLRPWLVGGIEKCLKECYAAVRTHIETGLAWTHLAIELHSLCAIVKGSKKCLSLLPSDIRKQLDVLPTVEYLRTLAAIYTSAGGEKVIETDSGANNLKNSIEAWCIDRLMERGTINHASEKTVETMVQVWDQVNNPDRQTLAILVSKCTGTDFTLRCRCLSQISTLSGGFVNTVLAILQDFKSRPEINCIGFIKLLANTQDAEVVQCFKRILYHMIESLQPTAIIDYSFQHLKASEWSQLMLQLSALFSDEIMNPSASPPFILQPHLHLWVQQLSAFLPVIARLEDILGPHAIAVKTILRGGEGLWVEHLVKLLEALTSASGYPAEKLMQQIVGKLSKEGNNASEVADCLKALLGTTPEGLAACERIYNAKHGLLNMPGLGSPPQTPAPTPASPMKLPRKPVPKAAPAQQEDIPVAVIEVIIAGYLQDDGFCGKAAIRVLAFLLNLEIYEWGIPKHKLRQATAYFAEQEMKLLEEVDRLQSLQKALRARDPKGTAILLAELGVDDISPLDDEIAGLPVGVMDAVEKHGDNEVGISFPFTSYTDLQRGAMGLGSAKTLLVRLFLDYLTDMPPAFCIHLDADPGETHSQHTPWSTSFTWQMGRIVHRYLKDKKGPVGIADLHGFVKQSMEDMTHGCVVCGQTHNARNTQLRRSTPCTSSGCTRIWNNVPVDIRIPELRTDTFAVDMILTTVYAAAMSGRTELLPGCPISNTTTVTAILNALPNLNTLRVATNISATLQACHQQAEKLLVWACTHFRGFIATASGICKIPGMPAGTHQFILANASPRLESDFAAKLPRFNPQTKVLFHGTSLDRLQSILVQGLKIYSGTALQRTGAAHGKGIYMAEEPATSFSYSPAAVSWRNSGLNNMRLLLGCEVVGNGRSVSSGIHVITDEKTVMVRYIFLLTNSSYAPNANHITPAMGSAMTALRSGTV
ncbi:hypothetical protein BU26DRAFT_492985 [Trematosphaeria pertusa]|uniref:PARP catalytic domain-containing protein n=1 Tax=Trematosphaeria pertusa TaxID=390896 RepID=A0A6A6HYQ3_9PLEO|nr:uncharacterized protein BU26DRAFT_492985 [Trematosphaeria pertusa]KAF2243191.1 hypothetical protein BU26DRAFT_492985 [Trematosphaeria pertusa]